MTKHQLEQIYYTERELKMWQRELDKLKARSSISSPLPHIGAGGGIMSDPTAQNAERVVELENKIVELKNRLQSERDEAVQFIMTIPDSVTRMIVYYRCVSLMNWRRVACEIGGGNTEESVRKIFTRFLEKL